MSDRQLEEPAGIEGYLTRHKTGTTPKQEVYVATHDGERGCDRRCVKAEMQGSCIPRR